MSAFTGEKLKPVKAERETKFKLKKQQSYDSFQDLQADARRVVDLYEHGLGQSMDSIDDFSMDLFGVGIDIAGEGLDIAEQTLEPVEEGLDIPKGLIDILYFIKELFTQKKNENADFTLSDLHMLLAEEFTRNADLQALASALAQSKQDEAKELSLLPTPSTYLPAPLHSDSLSLPLSDPIVLFCDGTGDHYEKEDATNVKVLHSLLCNAYPQWRESLLYVQGIGVGDTLDYIFAFSLPDKVQQIYRALCAQWRPGREIVVFGFSRGAFTARAVCALVSSIGIVQRREREAVSEERVSQIVDLFFSTPPTDAVSFTLSDDERQYLASDPSAGLCVRFLGLFDTVPGIPLPELAKYRHSLPCCFKDLVRESCHIQAEETSFLFENVSLHTNLLSPCRNGSLCVSPSEWSDLEAVRAFVTAKKHLEFRYTGGHSNIGGGWENEIERVRDKKCIANATLRLMLLASPFREIVPVLDSLSLFPVPSSEEEAKANVKSNLHYREGLSPIEKIQIIAMNMIELLSAERKAKNSTEGVEEDRRESRLLDAQERQQVRESVRKNLDAFNVTGELLKFLKAIIEAHNQRIQNSLG